MFRVARDGSLANRLLFEFDRHIDREMEKLSVRSVYFVTNVANACNER